MSDSALSSSIKALANDPDKELFGLGIKIGKLYTDSGFPIDMALNELKITKDEKIAVLNGALSWLIQHKRNSGASEVAVDRQRKANLNTLERFIKTDETGVY